MFVFFFVRTASQSVQQASPIFLERDTLFIVGLLLYHSKETKFKIFKIFKNLVNHPVQSSALSLSSGTSKFLSTI